MKKLALTGIFIALLVYFFRPYYIFVTQTLHVSLVRTVFPGKALNQTNGQVNILILGIAGGNHDGPDLSDSITVINYNFNANRLTTVGLPRDIWSETIRDKINSAYAYGTAKNGSKAGLKLAKAVIENVLNQPIHYAVVIDFSEFKSLIDYVGGIDIEVKRSFTDKEFPIAGKENDACGGDADFKCRYKTVTFTQGKEHMNGERALEFVRSRHASGEEGTDFARSLRQQQVLVALKTQVLTIIKSGNLEKIEGLYRTIDTSLTRDISNQDLGIIAKNVILKKGFSQKSVYFDQGLFEVPDAGNYDGKYVLIPKGNSAVLFHDYFACVVSDKTSCQVL